LGVLVGICLGVYTEKENENSEFVKKGENMNKEFWGWLLIESEKMKLPMRGAPTLRKHLERKYKQWKSELS
jgi:hypothetical protein